MNTRAIGLLALAALALLSENAFADGRHPGRGGRPAVEVRYARSYARPYVQYSRYRPYVVGAYVPVHDPVYRDYYPYDDYAYDDGYVRYVPYPPYRACVAYRPYPVYRYRPRVRGVIGVR
jgi:hypothetical protein